MIRHKFVIAACAALAVLAGFAPGLLASDASAVQHSLAGSRSGGGNASRVCAKNSSIGITVGKYRVTDNSWDGKTCMSVTGPASFRVDTNLGYWTGNVEAYPDIMFGTHFTSHTPGSYLPLPVRGAQRLPLVMTAYAHPPIAPGVWQADFDAWFSPSLKAADQHGTAELVIVTNYNPNARKAGRIVVIGRARWWFTEWLTCGRDAAGYCDTPDWPLMFFRLYHPELRATIRLGAFVRDVTDWGYVRRSNWLASAAFGFENWLGGNGEAASLSVAKLNLRRAPRRHGHGHGHRHGQ
jgi:hypothetical protein